MLKIQLTKQLFIFRYRFAFFVLVACINSALINHIPTSVCQAIEHEQLLFDVNEFNWQVREMEKKKEKENMDLYLVATRVC
jgi:hypothetical protein